MSPESGNDNTNPIPEWSVDFLAGWASGATAIVCLQPVDTVLTRWQAGLGRSWKGNVRSLWRGASPMITAVPLQNSLLMGGYGIGQRWFAGDAESALSYRRKMLAIFVGGCTGGTFDPAPGVTFLRTKEMAQHLAVPVSVLASQGCCNRC